jgi:hypothetical protein
VRASIRSGRAVETQGAKPIGHFGAIFPAIRTSF